MRPLAFLGDDRLSELTVLESLLQRLPGQARVRVLATVGHDGRTFPIHGIELGPDEPGLPTFAVIGGVHGLERIGTQVVLSYLTTLTELLTWDSQLRETLRRTRIVLVPLVNPTGMFARRRANANGVDLMRNAPPHPDGHGSWLLGGQRLSPVLPWFMGDDGSMEPEAQALCHYVEETVFVGDPAIVLDVHSGFGSIDRLWFPYARTRRPFPNLADVYGLERLLDRTLPNHVYRMEPQAQTYTIQGDLWDHLYDRHRARHPDRVFVPITLEMGSWAWVRKNPRQIFDALGTFNPMKPHRLRRILRRHLPLLDFLQRASGAAEAWHPGDDAAHERQTDRAFVRWYG